MIPHVQESLIDHTETAGKEALRKLDGYESSSQLDIPYGMGDVEALSWDDIDLGQRLDEGTFACVYEATLSRHRGKPAPPYAVKKLKHTLKENKDMLVIGAADLAVEAKLLAKLMHPNIIQLHGSTAGCVSEAFRDTPGFFLVLDLMVDTLDKRLTRWRREKKISHRFSYSREVQDRIIQQNAHIETVALGIAEGLAYLHSRNIIYRDLKAHNVGFDKHGVVRIFDFGLSREVDSQGTVRHLTGNAGTPLYMAPEVAKNETYGFPSDVYSYSILLWEILTLDRPFESIKSVAQFNEEVVHGKSRPSLKEASSPELKALRAKSWHDDQNERPDFVTVCQILRQHVSQSHSSKWKRPQPLRLCSPSSSQVEYFAWQDDERAEQVHENLDDGGHARVCQALASTANFSNTVPRQGSEGTVERILPSFLSRRVKSESSKSAKRSEVDAMKEILVAEVKWNQQFLKEFKQERKHRAEYACEISSLRTILAFSLF